MNRSGKNYDDMTPEELQREFREAFFETDLIDDYLNDELEKMQEALDREKPVEYLFTPEESWARFLTDNAEELEPFLHPESAAEINPQLPENDRFDPEKSWQRFMESRGEELAEFFGSDEAGPEKTQPRTARSHLVSALLRKVLIAAVIVVLLAGAALAANYTGLWAWVPRWNASSGRYEPTVQEGMPERPIPAALAELGITEPVYPAKLPEGFVITESHISEDPLVLMEQYARGNDRLSITIIPIDGFKTVVYQKSGKLIREYRDSKPAHYMFENEGTITAIWYTKNYAVFISGNLRLDEITQIIDSLE
jgi:hypothetical protein